MDAARSSTTMRETWEASTVDSNPAIDSLDWFVRVAGLEIEIGALAFVFVTHRFIRRKPVCCR